MLDPFTLSSTLRPLLKLYRSSNLIFPDFGGGGGGGAGGGTGGGTLARGVFGDGWIGVVGGCFFTRLVLDLYCSLDCFKK